MITIKKKQLLFTLTENWFGYKFKWSDLFLPVCYRGLRESDQQYYFGVKKHTNTVVLSLDEPVDTIYANFSTSLIRDIKKAKAEGVECILSGDMKTFVEFYNEFAKNKKLDLLDPKRINEYAVKEWKCSNAVINGQILAVHSYLEDKESGIVRLMQSGSLRFDNNYNPSRVAEANKLLHYHDILYFKNRGLKYYDFGGWNDLPGLLKFKQSFGGKPINIFNFFTYAYEIKEKVKETILSIRKNKVGVF